MKRIAFIAVLLALGCAVDPGKLRSEWQGATFDEVQSRWGKPGSTRTAPDGSLVATWIAETPPRTGSSGIGIGGVLGSGGRVGVGIGVGASIPVGENTPERCERTFTFRDNVVVDQAWRGSDALCSYYRRNP